MPWTCDACSASIETDARACHSCGAPKTSWTMSPDRTRNFVVTRRRRLQPLRGTADDELVDAEEAPAISKAVARRLAQLGEQPPARDLLTLRLTPSQRDELDLTVGVGYVGRELEERSFTRERPEDLDDEGTVDVPVLLVYGPGEPPSADAFPGVEVIDVSEAGDGHAPSVEVSGLGSKRAKELPVAAIPVPVMRIIELEDVSFHNDSAVLLPAAAGEGEGGELTGLAVVCAALRFVERFPDMKVLVAGHTDSVGSVEFNRKLSVLRAANVSAYLRGDREAWAASASERHEVEDWQQILSWLAATRGWSCDPGGVDNATGPKSQGGLRAFREAYAEAYGASLSGGDAPDKDDWAAFYDCYETALAGLLECEPSALGSYRERVRFLEAASVGCGEAWPVEAVGLDDHACQANRRVDVLFFEETEQPALRCHAGDACDPAGCDLYGAGRYRVEYLPVDVEGYVPADHVVLRLPIWTPEGEPIPGLDVEVDTGSATLAFVTDGEGVVEVLLPKPVPESIVLRWTHGGGQRSQTFTIDRSRFDSAPGQEQELRNLFFWGPGLRRALEQDLAHSETDLFGADAYRDAVSRAIALLNEEADA